MKELIGKKTLLIDNDVLSVFAKNASKHPLPKLIQEAGATAVINDAIRFEFLAFSRNQNETDELLKYLENFTSLSIQKDDIDNAIFLSQVYTLSQKESVKCSFVDCLNAAHALRYGGNLLLVTSNYRDYPTIVFDRLTVQAYDLDKEVVTIAVLKLNEDKYRAARDRYSKTAHANKK